MNTCVFAVVPNPVPVRMTIFPPLVAPDAGLIPESARE